MACTKNHFKTDQIVKLLPIDQGGVGRHKCASCAYEIAYKHGLEREENIRLLDVLKDIKKSQRGDRRHRSPHAAYALGYLDGVKESYK